MKQYLKNMCDEVVIKWIDLYFGFECAVKFCMKWINVIKFISIKLVLVSKVIQNKDEISRILLIIFNKDIGYEVETYYFNRYQVLTKWIIINRIIVRIGNFIDDI